MAFGLGNMKDIWKLQKEAKQMQNQMQALIIQGQSNSDLVSVTINGAQDILEIEIDDELMDPGRKKEMVKSLKEAFKAAQKKLQKEMMKDMDMDKLKSMLGG